MMDLRNLNSRLLLPPTLSDDLETKLFSLLTDEVMADLSMKMVFVQTGGDVKLLPEAILDNLAWELNVDFYDLDLALEKKQSLISNSIISHMIKGTPAAVENLLAAVFEKSFVEEWFEYGGQNSKFKIKTTDQADIEKYDKLKDIISLVKNTRSKLESFVLLRNKDISLESLCFTHTAKRITIDIT